MSKYVDTKEVYQLHRQKMVDYNCHCSASLISRRLAKWREVDVVISTPKKGAVHVSQVEHVEEMKCWDIVSLSSVNYKYCWIYETGAWYLFKRCNWWKVWETYRYLNYDFLILYFRNKYVRDSKKEANVYKKRLRWAMNS